MKYVLAIDQGTTGSRAIIYDKAGKAVSSAYEEFPQHFPQPGWVEHDPEQIWQSVSRSVKKAVSGFSGKICAVGITNQRETTVVWDKFTGKPVHNAIVWQCRRTAERCRKLSADKNLKNYIREKTGLPVDAYFSATKLEWLLKNVPHAMKKARGGRLLFGTADSWVLWKLTGGKVHATDYTNASRTMLFDIHRMAWDEKLLKTFGVPRSMLPEVKPSSGLFGETSAAAGLAAGIPICGIAGDQQAALFGQACFSPGEAKNTYGTGCFLLLNTGKKPVKSRFGLITTVCCDGAGKPAYALEGAVFIAGAAVQWLRDGLKIISRASETENLAESFSNNEGVYLVPAFVGLGAPHWNSGVRGAIFGLTRGTGAAHLARAALEAMCYQTKDVLEAMEKDSGLKINELKVDGGAAANNFLCQFQSDITRSAVVRPKTVETTSLGAAYLAGLSAGFWKNSAEIKSLWAADKKFSPKMPKKRAAELCSGWNKALSRLLVD